MSIYVATDILSKSLPADGQAALSSTEIERDQTELDFPGGRLWRVKNPLRLKSIFERRMLAGEPGPAAFWKACFDALRRYDGVEEPPVWQACFTANELTLFFLIDTEESLLLSSEDYFGRAD